MSKPLLSADEQELLIDAINRAELNTSGEIRVHVEALCKKNPVDRATTVFEKLGMHKTKDRNGILFYLAYEDHKFAVIGDEGIHKKVGQDFWDEIRNALINKFKDGLFVSGLTDAILLSGEKLKTYFPYASNDLNELNNEISFGKDGDDA